MKEIELKEKRKNKISEGVLLEEGILRERSSPTAFFYFSWINIPQNGQPKNEEWNQISTNTIKQTILFTNQKEEKETSVIYIYYQLQKFKEITKDYTLTSTKKYANQIDIVILEGENNCLSKTITYKQDDYKSVIIKEDMMEKARNKIAKENHREQKKFSREWGDFENWMPKELLELYWQKNTYKVGEADLSIKVDSNLVSRKKIIKDSIEGIYINVYIPVKLYEIEVTLFRNQEEILMTRKYILIL